MTFWRLLSQLPVYNRFTIWKDIVNILKHTLLTLMRSDYIRISHNLEDMFIYIPVAVGVAVADLFSKLVGSTTVASDISKSEN